MKTERFPLIAACMTLTVSVCMIIALDIDTTISQDTGMVIVQDTDAVSALETGRTIGADTGTATSNDTSMGNSNDAGVGNARNTGVVNSSDAGVVVAHNSGDLSGKEMGMQKNIERERMTCPVIISPSFISPAELVKFLGPLRTEKGDYFFFQGLHKDRPPVQIRINEQANLVVLTGSEDGIAEVTALIDAVDIPPRQIVIESRIIVIDQEEVKDLGIDWEELIAQASPNIYGSYDRDKRENISRSDGEKEVYYTDQTSKYLSGDVRLDVSDFLKIIQETGAGTVYSAPRIVTINNRRASISDGQRLTYLAKFSSYHNLFETQTIDAGLSLSILPSLGQSGYLTMDIVAKLTSITGMYSEEGYAPASDPIEEGQILENTVVVRDGETFLLGGLRRAEDKLIDRKVPILGTILPYFFSRRVTNKVTSEIFILITPRVIDLESRELDDRLKVLLEGDGSTDAVGEEPPSRSEEEPDPGEEEITNPGRE